jgi:hypothetical protein
MRDYLEFDCTPVEEECSQTGCTENYLKMQAIEFKVMRNQLLRMFGECETIEIKRKENFHDFGTYYSLHIYYDDDNETESEYVYNIEAKYPVKWDEQARNELTELGYKI